MGASAFSQLWAAAKPRHTAGPWLASLALHGLIIVGAIAFRVEAQPPPEASMEWSEVGPSDAGEPPPPEPIADQAPPEPTPELNPIPDEFPVPTPEPPQVIPPPTRALPARMVTENPRAAHPGPPRRSGASLPAPGINLRPVGWSTPRPVYPFAARRLRLTGTGVVEAWTDPAGRVVRCEVRGLAPALAAATDAFVRANWRGPASTRLLREIEYRLE